MTIFRHELRQGRTALAGWTAAIALLLAACVSLFPEMKGQMADVGGLFASMGRFTAAFGMDRLDIGTLTGFYAVECGNILGLGGGLFAAWAGTTALAKEERERTAQLLLTHPVSRARIVTEKLAALLAEITAMDLAVLALALPAVKLTGEAVPWRELLLIHGTGWMLHVELAGICFGISAFLRRAGAGVGMGLTAAMYVLNLLANMTQRAGPLRYITPFAYCEGADILARGVPDAGLVAVGALCTCGGVAAAYWKYSRKDIL